MIREGDRTSSYTELGLRKIIPSPPSFMRLSVDLSAKFSEIQKILVPNVYFWSN